MRSLSPDLKQFMLRFLVVAGLGILAGFLRWGSLIFISRTMSFQFTQISLTAGLAYALFKRTPMLNSFLILFFWFLVFTALEAFGNRWMYVLNLTYIAGISFAIWVYLYLLGKSVIRTAIQRVACLTVAFGIVNTLHVIVLVLISWRSSNAQNPHFISEVLNTCWFNFQTGILIGLAAGVGIEAVDHSLIPRTGAALKSWALDANDA